MAQTTLAVQTIERVRREQVDSPVFRLASVQTAHALSMHRILQFEQILVAYHGSPGNFLAMSIT